MKRVISRFGRLPALALLLASSSCAGMAGWEEVLGGLAGMDTREVRGEVDRIDARAREIQLRSSFGRATRVQYDSRTEVIAGRRRYDVRELERGDLVSMYLQRGRGGELYTDRIYLEGRAGRDREEVVGRVGSRQWLEGRADRIDTRNGRFELADRRRGTVIVTLPYEPSRSTRDRFRRLRRGDHVRIEAQVLSGRVVQLVRFD